MFFRIYDHYYDSDEKMSDVLMVVGNDITNDDIKEPDECFICYEYNSEKSNYPIHLNTQDIYKKMCVCDGWIHSECLDKWFQLHKQCPICRIIIIEDVEQVPTINTESRYTIFSRKMKRVLVITIKIYSVLSCVFLFFLFYEFYYPIIEIIHNQFSKNNTISERNVNTSEIMND
jgi:hypothetical protein